MLAHAEGEIVPLVPSLDPCSFRAVGMASIADSMAVFQRKNCGGFGYRLGQNQQQASGQLRTIKNPGVAVEDKGRCRLR